MAEREPGKITRPRTPTTPADYPIPPTPLSGIDHSFLLQAIMEVQRSIGQLTQAVTTLTDTSKEHGKKLEEVRMDMHGAKSGAKVLLWVVGIVGTLVGIVLAAYFRKLFRAS